MKTIFTIGVIALITGCSSANGSSKITLIDSLKTISIPSNTEVTQPDSNLVEIKKVYPKFTGEKVVVAIFPFKNLSGEVKYDSLMFSFSDSLEQFFNKNFPLESHSYKIIPMQDVKDQIAALNIDLKGITYETKTWEVAKLLGAEKIIWGTYYVKYEKAQIEAKVVDVKTKMPNNINFAEKIRVCLLYTSPSPRDRTRSRMPSSA